MWISWSFLEIEISFDSSHTSSPKFRPVFQLLEQGKECSTSLKGEGCWQPQKTGDIWYGSQAWISRPPLGFSYLTIINRLRVTHVLVKYVMSFQATNASNDTLWRVCSRYAMSTNSPTILWSRVVSSLIYDISHIFMFVDDTIVVVLVLPSDEIDPEWS